MRQLFDMRLHYTGQKKLLSKGYTLPKIFIEVTTNESEKEKNASTEEIALYIHQLTRNDEWDPFILYPTLFSVNQIQYNRNGVLRVLYQKSRNITKSMTGRKTVFFNAIIDRLYSLYRKFHK
ncbi:hypothetical protein D3C78_1551900 [compost metagenome]